MDINSILNHEPEDQEPNPAKAPRLLENIVTSPSPTPKDHLASPSSVDNSSPHSQHQLEVSQSQDSQSRIDLANRGQGSTSGSTKKRKFDDTSAFPPAKYPRRREMPIWAQPAKNVRPLAKYLQAQKNDEVMTRICQFIYRYVVQNEWRLQPEDGAFEIEAKIGKMEDADEYYGKDLLHSAASQEIALPEGCMIKFRSDTTKPVHAKLNAELNSAVSTSLGPINLTPHRKPIIFKHRHEVDSLYNLSDADKSNLSPQIRRLLRPNQTYRVRVTRNKDETEILAKIIKIRIADLHVQSLNARFDYRISINFEANWNGDLDTLIAANEGMDRDDSQDRRKDRMSYAHCPYQVDLTQVMLKRDDDKDEKERRKRASHELEVELDAAAVMELAQKGDGPYDDLIRGYLADIRILARGSGRIGNGPVAV